MPTLFAVYNLKKGKKAEEYDDYLTKTKIPAMQGESWFINDFKTWKIDKVLASAVSEPEGKLPTEPPYQYVAKIEVSDLCHGKVSWNRRRQAICKILERIYRSHSNLHLGA